MAAESFIATTKTVNICAHCGASSAFLKHANSFFCCDGCRRVYTILKEQNLLGYYEMGENTPLSLKGEAVHDFSYADSVWFHKTFTTPLSHGRYQMRLKLPAIHCAACVWLLEKLPEMLPHVLGARINYLRKELTVVAQDSLSVSKLVQFVTDLGYTPDFKPESSRSRSLTQYDKGLLKRMAVAAFGFGNAMFFSLPDYLTHNLETRFQTLFITLNLSLALLVLFYSAGEFFTNAWRALKKKKIILDLPIALGIVAMFTRSVLEISVGVSSGYFDTFAGLIFFLLIGRYVQSRSYTYLAFERDNLLFLPLAVRVVHEGAGEKTTPVQDLRTQDTIRLLNGEIAPTRCRVLSDSVAVDYSFTTGESQPVILPKGDILEIGGKVVGHSALFSVMEPVDQARVNRVWESATSDTAEISFTEESSFADKVLPYFTLIVLGIATAGFLYWLPQDTTMAWNVFTAVVVITCPCALAMAKPFSFYTTLSALGRSGLFLKSAAVVEKFFNIGTIILDKTGTITSAHEYDVTFHGVDNQILSEEAAVKIYSLTRESTHPLSKAITAHLAQNKDFIFADALAFEEVLGEGLSARVDGTLCVLGSRRYLESKNSTVTKSDADTTSSVVHVGLNGRYMGFFAVVNRARKNLESTLDALARTYRLQLVSGDSEREKARFEKVFPQGAALYFNATPDDKAALVAEAEKIENALVIGDGLNDAKALRTATLGIALSENQANFSPASDAILSADAFERLPNLLGQARFAKTTAITAYIISFAYNVFGVSVALTGQVTPLFCAILMPISSLTVIGFAFASSRFKAYTTAQGKF